MAPDPMPLVEGEVYDAVVTKVDDSNREIHVRIGHTKGVVDKKGMKWIKEYLSMGEKGVESFKFKQRVDEFRINLWEAKLCVRLLKNISLYLGCMVTYMSHEVSIKSEKLSRLIQAVNTLKEFCVVPLSTLKGTRSSISCSLKGKVLVYVSTCLRLISPINISRKQRPRMGN